MAFCNGIIKIIENSRKFIFLREKITKYLIVFCQALDKDRRLLTIKLENESTALKLACEFSSPELVDKLLKTLK